jgi:hypothetical protein
MRKILSSHRWRETNCDKKGWYLGRNAITFCILGFVFTVYL